MSMMRCAIALSLFCVVSAATMRAEGAPLCSVTAAQDQDVTIACSGLGETVGKQLADILTRILQDRLDPPMVMAKLDEVDRVPEEGVARAVDEHQRQLIIQSLFGKPAGEIAIITHPEAADGAELAKAIAMSLLQAGWQIEGQQIRRTALPSIESVRGIAVVVRDRGEPPPLALRLKTALNAAQIAAALVADPTMAPDATVLWVGRRPTFSPAMPAK
jgi:hypothetical protein